MFQVSIYLLVRQSMYENGTGPVFKLTNDMPKISLALLELLQVWAVL